jgi:hypothetical protein
MCLTIAVAAALCVINLQNRALALGTVLIGLRMYSTLSKMKRNRTSQTHRGQRLLITTFI